MKLINSLKSLLVLACISCITPALAQEFGSYEMNSVTMEKEEDFSGLLKGKWIDINKEKGEVELKVYRQHLNSYAGYILLKDARGVIYTGVINFSIEDGYFSGYYTPSAYAMEENASALSCQLIINGAVKKDKKHKLALTGEAVSTSCYQNNIFFLDIKHTELIAKK